jgi:hypothetical protein
MSINVKVPISTEVIESNPDCKIRGFFEKGFEAKVFFKNICLENWS